ncbi:MAG: 30S ribosomal protein S8 [Planctomycetaceae bacterium]
MSDPVADMLTCIRNAVAAERAVVEFPTSKLRVAIADALQRHGYIWDFEVVAAEGDESKRRLRINLKYGPTGERVIQQISCVSRPGRRVYSSVGDIPNVLQGLGICLLSTNRGVLGGGEAKKANVGGEVLCVVW